MPVVPLRLLDVYSADPEALGAVGGEGHQDRGAARAGHGAAEPQSRETRPGCPAVFQVVETEALVQGFASHAADEHARAVSTEAIEI